MDSELPKLPAGALRTELIQDRTDPRVVAIAGSLHLDLADESVWQRILGQAECNYQREIADATRLDSVANSTEGHDGLLCRHAAAAISAYQATEKL